MKNRLTYIVKCARPALGLVLAYAFALQVLLASVVAGGMAAVPPGEAAVICYASGVDGDGRPAHAPAHFADCVLACAQGLSGAAVLAVVAAISVFAAGNAIEPAPAAAPDLPSHPSPKLAQGPPQNA